MKLEKYWENNNNSAKQLTTVLFIIYLVVLTWILVFKLGVRFSYMGNRRVNLIPFKEPVILNGKIDLGEMILNVLIFVPLGIYAGILYKNWFIRKKLFFFFLISLIVEVLQYILRVGAFDITDIITNTSGGIIGLIIFKAIEKIFNNKFKAQRFVNIIATIGTVLLILFLVLLKTNNLGIRYQ